MSTFLKKKQTNGSEFIKNRKKSSAPISRLENVSVCEIISSFHEIGYALILQYLINVKSAGKFHKSIHVCQSPLYFPVAPFGYLKL